jgi:O-antigen/teichoic acid export membrane protein
MSLARSGIGWMITRFGGLAASWLASLYFARAFVDPQATLGTYYAFETVLAFLVLFANGGLNSAIVKRVSEGEEAAEFATAGILASGALVIVFSVATLLFSPLLIDFFGYGGLSVVLLIATLFAYQTKDTLKALLTSNFNLGRAGVVDLVDSIVQVGMQVFLVVAGLGALALVTGYVIGSVAAATVAIGLVLRRFDWARPSKRHFQSLFDFARYSLLNNFVQKFYDNIDIIIITYFLGKSATGVYGIGFRFSLILTVFYSAINQISNPEISKQETKGNNERIKELLSDTIILGLLFGIPAFTGFVVLARPVMITFYTEEFAGATLVAVGAVATRIPEGLRSSIGSVLAGIDRPDIGFRGGMILIATNIILDVLLIPTIGVIGAVIASFVGMTFQLMYMTTRLVQILELDITDFPFKEVSRELIAAVLMSIVVYGAQTTVQVSSVVVLLGLIVLGISTYFIIILLVAPGIRTRLLAISNDIIPY